MSADALSQEEIDALLKGAGGGSEPPGGGLGGGHSGGSGEPPKLTSEQVKGLQKYGDRMASTLGEMIGTFLAQPARATRQEPIPQTSDSLANEIPGDVVMGTFSYEGSLAGHSAIVFNQADATRIGGTMFGDPDATEFTNMIGDAVKEVINTVIGNLGTALSAMVGRAPGLGHLEIEAVRSASETYLAAAGGEEKFVVIPYDLSLGDLPRTQCWQILSMDLVRSLESIVRAPQSMAAEGRGGPMAAPVQFESLTAEPSAAAPPNLGLILDIGLEVRVELGRTQMRIRDVLNLGSGSVVELDKLAGEPVDLLVNDVIFAKGEVVVIDENFGVRVTDILSLDDRIKTLGERKE